MALRDTKVKNAKASHKTTRLYDGNGLYLEVFPKGGKWWRYKYRFNSKEKRLSLGVYPDIKLKKARDKRDDARCLLADGIDLAVHRKVTKSAQSERAANGLENVAREEYAKYRPTWSKRLRPQTMDIPIFSV